MSSFPEHAEQIFINFCNFSHKIEAHHRKLPVHCPVCNKVFPGNRILKYHLKIHRTPNIQCDLCGKKLKTRNELRIHMKRHIKKKMQLRLSIELSKVNQPNEK